MLHVFVEFISDTLDFTKWFNENGDDGPACLCVCVLFLLKLTTYYVLN